MRLTRLLSLWREPTGARRAGRTRAAAGLIAVAALVLTASIAFAQSSAAYDLACRGALTGGGGVLIAPSNTYGLLGVVGQSPAGESKSPNYGVRGGYVQPGSFSAVVAANAATVSGAEQTNRSLLPFLARVLRVVRGGC